MTIKLDDAFDSHQREDWLALAEKSLSDGQTLGTLSSTTLDGRSIEALYSDRPDTVPSTIYAPLPVNSSSSSDTSSNTSSDSSIDLPLWDNRATVWMCTPQLANQATLTALEGGATSIELHLGDHAGWSATGLPEALKGVYLDAASISLREPQIGSDTADILMDLWDANSITPHDAKGTFNLDPVGDHLRGQTSNAFSLDDSLQTLQAFVEHTHSRYPTVPAVLVDGCCHHNAGATATQELLAVIATGSLYLEALKNTSIDPALISRTLQLQMSTDANTLMGVVKLRSLKMLWQHLLAQLDLPVVGPSLVVETSRRHLSALDPWVNHLRNTAAVSAAAFVNAETIIVHPHNVIDGKCLDENKDDVELGLRVARNLPIILSEESRLTDVQDPFAGSYAIEHLCQDLCSAVWSALSENNTARAWFDTVTSGEWRDSLYQSHLSRSAQLNTDDRVMVGVNRYRSNENVPSPIDPPSAATVAEPSTLQMVRDGEHYEERSS